jgi:hypothetical protein
MLSVEGIKFSPSYLQSDVSVASLENKKFWNILILHWFEIAEY